MSSLTNASQFRRRVGAGSIVGLILAVFASGALDPTGLTNLSVSRGTAVLDHLDHYTRPFVMPFLFAMPFALLLLAAAVVRAQLAPRWVLVVAGVFWATDYLPSFSGSEAVQLGFGLLAFGWIARRLMRAGDLEWEGGLVLIRSDRHQPVKQGGAAPAVRPR